MFDRVRALPAFVLLIAACSGGTSEPDDDDDPDPPEVATVTIQAHPDSIVVGSTLQLQAQAADADGVVLTGRTTTWQVSPTTRASISTSGLVTAIDAGTVTVTATVEGEQDADVLTIHLVPVDSVVVRPDVEVLANGDTVTITATARDATGAPLPGRTIEFSTDAPGVATVSSTGLVTAIGEGTATITASSGPATSHVNITVAPCTNSIRVATSRLNLPIKAGGIEVDGGLDASGRYRTRGVLYATGLVVGTSGPQTHLSYNPKNVPTSFAATPICQLASSTYARLRFANGVTGIPSLRITQETFSVDSTVVGTDYVLFRYTFYNDGATPITNLRAGMYADWDLALDVVGSGGLDDVARYLANTAEVRESDSTNYPGVLGLSTAAASGTRSYAGWLNGADPDLTSAYYDLLGSVGSTATITGDIRVLVGRNGLTIAAGQRSRVYFIFVGGANRTEYNTNLTAALARAQSLGL